MSSKLNDDDDYWNTSENKGFDFDVEKTNYPTSKNDHLLFIDDNISECSYELPSNDMPLSQIISDTDLRMILEEQSMCDPPLPKNITIEDEVKILRRQILDKIHTPTPELTINKIILGKPYSLELYKTLKDKEELLDESIRIGCGDAILSIILFIVRTLKKSHVNRIIQKRPIVANHYLNYLITRLKINEATDLLTMMGKSNEAGILQFHLTKQLSNTDSKKLKLKQIYSNFFNETNNFYSQMIGNYINLLEWQGLEKNLFKNNYSVLKSLFILSENHKWFENQSRSSNHNKNSLNLTPQNFADLYQISPEQYEWVVLNERAKTQAWLDVVQLFKKKSFLKSNTFVINLPIDKIILQLYALKAPASILNEFLSQIDSPNRRLAMSKHVCAIRSEIDSLVLLKDKKELEILRDRLENGTEERFYAENALKNLNTKWKT